MDKKEEILRISGVNVRKCMRCGKCSGTCPSYDEMEYHPHQFVYMVESGDIEPLLKSESLYKLQLSDRRATITLRLKQFPSLLTMKLLSSFSSAHSVNTVSKEEKYQCIE